MRVEEILTGERPPGRVLSGCHRRNHENGDDQQHGKQSVRRSRAHRILRQSNRVNV
jgi:hypothetical protein